MSDRAHHTPFLVARPGNAARVICCDSCVGSRARLPAGVDTIDTEPEGELISAMCLMSSFAHSYDDKTYSQRAAAKDGGEVELRNVFTTHKVVIHCER